MTTPPTRDEVTAALDILRRMPGVTHLDTLADIAVWNTPIYRMAFEIASTDPFRGKRAFEIVNELNEIAARHGLRITTDSEPAPAATWMEPADWPIPGHAPGLYTAYSTGDGHGPAVITENGRLLIQQNDESGSDSDAWQDRTDLYQSAQWPLTPVTVRSTTAPGELVGSDVEHR